MIDPNEDECRTTTTIPADQDANCQIRVPSEGVTVTVCLLGRNCHGMFT